MRFLPFLTQVILAFIPRSFLLIPERPIRLLLNMQMNLKKTILNPCIWTSPLSTRVKVFSFLVVIRMRKMFFWKLPRRMILTSRSSLCIGLVDPDLPCQKTMRRWILFSSAVRFQNSTAFLKNLRITTICPFIMPAKLILPRKTIKMRFLFLNP